MSQFAETFQTCHAERRASPGERGPQIAPLLRELGQDSRDQRKSKHPENLSFAMPLQGVLPKHFRENALVQHGTRCILGILRRALVPQAGLTLAQDDKALDGVVNSSGSFGFELRRSLALRLG